MLTTKNLTPLCRALSESLSSPHIPLNHFQIRNLVASAVVDSGPNVLQRQLEKRPEPWDETTCNKLAAVLSERGLPSLPAEIWAWPIPEGFSLEPEEVASLIAPAFRRAVAGGRISAQWLELVQDLAFGLIPAGKGTWATSPTTLIPIQVLREALAPVKVLPAASPHKAPAHREQSGKDFYFAIRAMRDGDFAGAFALLERAAASNHMNGMFNLAYLLETGQGCEVDLHRAVSLYRHAADLGCLSAHHNLANIFAMGDLGAVDKVLAERHYQVAADAGHVPSQSAFGRSLWHSDGGAAVEEKAQHYLLLAGRAGDGPALNTLGTILERRAEHESDAAAASMFRFAAKGSRGADSALPFFNLARFYYWGKGVTRNLRMARKLFRRAAQAGDADAQFLVARMYTLGEGGKVDQSEARKWAELAEQAGHADAMCLLGAMDLNGEGIAGVDSARAVERLSRAAEQLNTNAMHFLGMLHIEGRHVRQDEAYGKLLLSRAAQACHQGSSVALQSFESEAFQ